MAVTPVVWLERGLAKAAQRPAIPTHWCQCDGKGTCVGCLILTLIQKHYGTGGVMYLLDAIKAAERGEDV